MQTTIDTQADLRALFAFTKIHVESAREMARSGQKDEARNRLRFIRNARIIQLLKLYENSGSPFDIDVSHLEWNLRQLEDDCHPLTTFDCSNDFAAIRGSLEFIAGATVTAGDALKRDK